MNNKIIFGIIMAVLALTACDKSDLEKQVEKDTAISKKMGEVKNIPRITIAPDKKGEK